MGSKAPQSPPKDLKQNEISSPPPPPPKKDVKNKKGVCPHCGCLH